jgi:hypothetical protein
VVHPIGSDPIPSGSVLGADRPMHCHLDGRPYTANGAPDTHSDACPNNTFSFNQLCGLILQVCQICAISRLFRTALSGIVNEHGTSLWQAPTPQNLARIPYGRPLPSHPLLCSLTLAPLNARIAWPFLGYPASLLAPVMWTAWPGIRTHYGWLFQLLASTVFGGSSKALRAGLARTGKAHAI